MAYPTTADWTLAHANLDRLNSIINGSVTDTVTLTDSTAVATMRGLMAAFNAYNNRGAWGSSTAYVLKDVVLQSSILYFCLVAHTSTGSFSTDLAAGKWGILQYNLSDNQGVTKEFTNQNTNATGLSSFVAAANTTGQKAIMTADPVNSRARFGSSTTHNNYWDIYASDYASLKLNDVEYLNITTSLMTFTGTILSNYRTENFQPLKGRTHFSDYFDGVNIIDSVGNRTAANFTITDNKVSMPTNPGTNGYLLIGNSFALPKNYSGTLTFDLTLPAGAFTITLQKTSDFVTWTTVTAYTTSGAKTSAFSSLATPLGLRFVLNNSNGTSGSELSVANLIIPGLPTSWCNSIAGARFYSTGLDAPSVYGYKLAGVTVLSGTALGSTIVSSSLTSLGTITTGVWHGTVVDGLYGGTGVANSGKTITLGGNLTTSGAFGTTITSTATTSVTLPVAGTLIGKVSTTGGTRTQTVTNVAGGTSVLVDVRDTSVAASGTVDMTFTDTQQQGILNVMNVSVVNGAVRTSRTYAISNRLANGFSATQLSATDGGTGAYLFSISNPSSSTIRITNNGASTSIVLMSYVGLDA